MVFFSPRFSLHTPKGEAVLWHGGEGGDKGVLIRIIPPTVYTAVLNAVKGNTA